MKLRKYEEKLHDIGFLRSRSCINAPTQDCIYCVHLEAIEPLLKELHEGIYGNHIGRRSLLHQALTQGYWWPNM